MKSVLITESIKKAFLSLCNDSKMNQEEICKMLGISRSTLIKWKNDTDASPAFIKPFNWKKVYPYIEKYLPVEYKNGSGQQINAPISGSYNTLNNHSPNNFFPESETCVTLRKKISDAILDSDISAEDKIKALKIIKDAK